MQIIIANNKTKKKKPLIEITNVLIISNSIICIAFYSTPFEIIEICNFAIGKNIPHIKSLIIDNAKADISSA